MTRRLILAFVVLCVGEALLVSWLVNAGTQRTFRRFLREEAIGHFVEDATAHYRAHGTWNGLPSAVPR